MSTNWLILCILFHFNYHQFRFVSLPVHYFTIVRSHLSFHCFLLWLASCGHMTAFCRAIWRVLGVIHQSHPWVCSVWCRTNRGIVVEDWFVVFTIFQLHVYRQLCVHRRHLCTTLSEDSMQSSSQQPEPRWLFTVSITGSDQAPHNHHSISTSRYSFLHLCMNFSLSSVPQTQSNIPFSQWASQAAIRSSTSLSIWLRSLKLRSSPFSWGSFPAVMALVRLCISASLK